MLKQFQLSILLLTSLISCTGPITSQISSDSISGPTFTVLFDSRGGSEVSSQTVQSNAIIVPPNVSKEGHTLEGWFTSVNGGATLENKWNFFSDRVNFDFTLYASWTVNQYTITFNTNDGVPIQTQTNNFASILNIPNATKVGHTFDGWFTDIESTQVFALTTMPASNLNLYAKWSINQYTITFESNGGTTIPSISGDYGDSVSVPVNPTREGYTFSGWHADVELAQVASVPNTIPAQNLNVYAKWIINQYSITFMTNGGSDIQSQTIDFNSTLNVPNAIKVGHSFEGWFTDLELTLAFALTTMPAENVALYAKWAINQYTVTFETNGGNTIPSITGNYGDSMNATNNPEKEGYTFNGWYADAELMQVTTVVNTIPAENLTFYAKWSINQYTMTFNTNGGNSIQTQTNDFNATLNVPNATKVGHSFEGWFGNIELTGAFVLTTMPAENLNLYAKWTINQYTISFVTNGGNTIPSITGDYGDPVSELNDPIREGYIFSDWYTDAGLTQVASVPNSIPSQNLTLYAGWITDTDGVWYLVGNFSTSIWGGEGFVAADKLTKTGRSHTKTLDLLIGYQFKLVHMVGSIPTWNGISSKGTVLPADFSDAISGTDNFEVNVNGNYSVTIDDSVSPVKINFVRLGDPIVAPAPEMEPADWFIVGNLTNPQWAPSNKSLALRPVTGVPGSYFIDLDLVLGNQFKLKTGDTWDTGRDLGFSTITSVTTGLFSNEGNNINSLVSGKFRVRINTTPSSEAITITPLGWIGYSTVVTQGATSATIAYENPTPADWGRNTQLRLMAPFDQTKEGVEFDFTGKAGDEYLFKVEGPGVASERMATATGDAQKFIVPVAQLTPTQRSAINLFVIFARTGGSTGTLVVRDWKYVDSVTPAAPEWRAEGGATATMNGNAMTFTYTARANFWEQNAQIPVIGFDGSKSSVTVPFTGVAGQEYMFKFEYPGHTNNVEIRVIATGQAQTITMDLANLTPEIRATINKFVVFSTTTGASGSLQVSSYYYNPAWIGEGGAVISQDAPGVMTMTYTARGNFWDQNAQLGVVGYDSSKTSLTVAFTGVANQQYMFKVEFVGGNREFFVTATGAAQTTTLDLSTLTPQQRASINKFVIFSYVNTNAGSITVTSWN
jgi:uncharacterized repeat protein (TIGR02543 family)